jgi:polyphosphate glucokinase
MTLSLGIDVGGSGIKAAIVDLATGEFTTERVRVETPQPATPDSVVAATAGLIADLGHDGPIGIGVPSPIVKGVTPLASNLDPAWVGAHAEQLFSAGLGAPVRVINDADAAGVAEARYGAAHGVEGLVVLLTLGTGIGSALLYNGVLVPNTEMGHIQVRGKDAEHRAAASVREVHDLSWHHWAERLQEVIEVIDRLFWPDLVLLGGGVSRKADKFLHFLDVRPPLRAAALENRAGIVGAAAAAADRA